MVVHGRQIDEDQDESETQFNAQCLPFGQSGCDDGRTQVSLVSGCRNSVPKKRQEKRRMAPITIAALLTIFISQILYQIFLLYILSSDRFSNAKRKRYDCWRLFHLKRSKFVFVAVFLFYVLLTPVVVVVNGFYIFRWQASAGAVKGERRRRRTISTIFQHLM